MTVNTELLFKGNNRDVADVQEIQASVANCMYHFNEQGDSAFCPQKLWTMFPTVLAITSDYFLKEH